MSSIVGRIEQFAAERPQSPAMIGAGGRASYAALWQGTAAAAAWLHACGVRRGDTAAISLDLEPENALRHVFQFYALAWLGCIVLPLFPDAPAPVRQRLIERFAARWLVSATGREPASGAALLHTARLPSAEGSADDPAWIAAHAPRGDAPDRPFLYMFTSGTTGEPKVCLFTHDQLASYRMPFARAVGSTPEDRELAPAPWPTNVGMRYLTRMHSIGGTFVNMAFPESRAALARLMRELSVTHAVGSPWQLRRLLASDQLPPGGLPQLRGLYVGGAFTAPEELHAIRESLARNAYLVYGSSELGAVACIPPGVMPEAPGTVGRLLPSVEAQAVDAGHRALAPGEVGQLRFRTPWSPAGYIGNEEATAKHFRDGWFYPGDLGSIDAEGVVRLRGRVDEVINFGGVKIVPADIESVLLEHPDVADAALVGMPDAMAGEVPVAFVVLRREASPEDVASFCFQRVDGQRRPARFVRVQAIPRNEAGKIVRERLREVYRG